MRRTSAPGLRRRATFLRVPSLFALVLASGCSGERPTARVEGRYVDEVFATGRERDLAYGSAVNERGEVETLLLDLYYPEQDPAQRRPAVVWIHGGGFTDGHRSSMGEYARRFAARGYVSVSISYRLRQGAGFDYTDTTDPRGLPARTDAQHDAQAAVRWLRANARRYRVDPERIAVAGYSAGGITALRVGYSSDDPGGSGNPGHSSRVGAAVAIAAAVDTMLIDAGDAPALLLHGMLDRKVPPAMAEGVCAAASHRGLRCRLVLFPQDHTLIETAREEIVPHIAAFLVEELAP